MGRTARVLPKQQECCRNSKSGAETARVLLKQHDLDVLNRQGIMAGAL